MISDTDAISGQANATAAPPAGKRLLSIDALRGLVILLMLVDHTREFFYLHRQVVDPMDVAATDPDLFFTRIAAHLCAPVFVALTGIAAFLYGEARGGTAAASAFLVKRGLFLVVLEWTVVNFAWTFDLTPATVFLQVIWVIGLSMIALALLIRLPRGWLVVLGAAIVLGHNLLDPVQIEPGQWGHAAWTILHDRGYLDLPGATRARASYPLLPWIGVIAIGYAVGPWFRSDAAVRQRRLLVASATLILSFVLLRAVNIYGDPTPWVVGADALRTVMGFVNLTKYPPSADFLLLTLGAGALLIAWFERLPAGAIRWLAVYGAAPLFFYIVHLYLLHALNRLAGVMAPAAENGLVSVPSVGWLWMLAAAVAVPCWYACRWFGRRKRASGQWWMRYL